MSDYHDPKWHWEQGNRLKQASAAQREKYEIVPMGIHWPDIDEDLSVAGMLKGQRAKPSK
jgi:hypothetical protein